MNMKNLATKTRCGIIFAILLVILILAACGAPDAFDVTNEPTSGEVAEEWATITVDCRRNNFGEFLTPTRVYSFKVGESCEIINPEIKGFVTAWPVIRLGNVQGDERFVVQYYGEDEITQERLAEMAGKRTVIIHYNYGNGALHIAPDQVMELPVGDSFVAVSPMINNYKPDVDKIADVVRTDCPPEGAKSYTVNYDFTGDPADEPFQLSLDYSFATTVAEHAAWYVCSTDFYWYTENEEFDIELPQFVGFRPYQSHLTGTMGRENQHFWVSYVEDPTQTEGEVLEKTSTPPSYSDPYSSPGVVHMN